jgi:hypothetical protein
MSLIVEIQVVGHRLVFQEENVPTLIGSIKELLPRGARGSSCFNAGFFEYKLQIQVRHPVVRSFEINKRFSELARLDETLSQGTKFLPYFPPRGAHRILTDEHAMDRRRLLNSYFRIICQMEEVVHSRDFQAFFALEECFKTAPLLIGKLLFSDDTNGSMRMSSLSVSEDFILVGLGKYSNFLSKATELFSSWIKSGPKQELQFPAEFQIWNRLPNSFLFERRFSIKLEFNVTVTYGVEGSSCHYFGLANGRVGYVDSRKSYMNEDVTPNYLNGIVHGGNVTSLQMDGGTLWTGGDDGYVYGYDLVEGRITARIMSDSCEGSGITRILVYEGLIYAGKRTGVINIYQSDGLRLITLLQGPPSPIVGLGMIHGGLLYSAHSGTTAESTEGFNTIQFWDVSQVLTRGTSKLAHWGPAASTIVSVSPVTVGSSTWLTVASSNGSVSVFAPSLKEITHRAKYLFRVESKGSLPENSLGVHGDHIYAGSDAIYIFKLPPHSLESMTVLDISAPDGCQSLPRDMIFGKLSAPSGTLAHQVEDEDDLHSWARP